MGLSFLFLTNKFEVLQRFLKKQLLKYIMDTTLLITISILVIAAIVSIVFGILSFIKYSKTRKNIYLALGIILTFVVPGILLYLAFRFYVSSTMVVYMPGPDNGIVYMPGPA